MRNTTNNGWPVAEGTDPAKQYPAVVDGPFKDDLDAQIVRAYVATERESDGGVGADTFGPLIPQLFIASAPPGVYLTAVFACIDKSSPVASALTLAVMKGGTVWYSIVRDAPGDMYMEFVTASVMLLHTSGNLAVDWSMKGAVTGLVALGGSRGFLTRVSV